MHTVMLRNTKVIPNLSSAFAKMSMNFSKRTPVIAELHKVLALRSKNLLNNIIAFQRNTENLTSKFIVLLAMFVVLITMFLNMIPKTIAFSAEFMNEAFRAALLVARSAAPVWT